MTTPAASEPALSPPASRLTHLAAILIIILFSLPILLIFLGTGDPTNTMELFNLVPVREAYRDGNWLMPTLNGMPRFEKPPLCVWLPAGLATLVGSDSLWVVRMPSLILAIASAVATYLLACQIFRNPGEGRGVERKYALFAALFVPAMFAFDRHARLASYDIYATACALFAAAFLVTLAEQSLDDANQPQQIPLPRWLGLTFLAGLALGCSLLSKGPAPAATILVPTIVWLLIFHRRRAVLWGVAGMVFVSLAVALPWLIVIVNRYEGAWLLWKAEFVKLSRSRSITAPEVVFANKRPWYYYFQIFFWTAPFTPLFIAGLCLPFLRSESSPAPSTREQRGRWLAWIVVIGGLVLLSIPSVKELRYAIQILPFAGILCVAVGQEFLRLPRQKKIEPAGGIVLVAQALFFLIPAIGGLVLAIWLQVRGTLPKWAGGDAAVSMVQAIGPWTLAAFALVLLVGAVLLWQKLARREFVRGAVLLIACAWLMTLTVQWIGRADPANHANVWRPGIEKALTLVGDAPVGSVVTFPGADQRPWLSTLYYYNHRIPELSPPEVAEVIASNPARPVYVFVIVSSYGKEHPEAAANLAAVAQASGRRPEFLYEFTDERRQTAVVKFAPAAP